MEKKFDGGGCRRSLTKEAPRRDFSDDKHGLTSPDLCRPLSKLAPLSEESCVEVSILRKRNEDLVKGCIRRFKDYEKQLPESKVLAKEAGIDEDMAGELRKQLKWLCNACKLPHEPCLAREVTQRRSSSD
ncbi:Uncharacterized protein Rs2_36027 [Raphanus sativus]|nr:Uncharacterized protein Rs2_36027 [Raphanus sativus]